MEVRKEVEVWGGIECTINRVGDQYMDQSEYTGHYSRGVADIDLVASLGFKMVRYPVLWERHQPVRNATVDWSFVEKNLVRLRELNITPIAGLVHHGSGPEYVNFFDGSYENGLAEYATLVIKKFPWLEYFTPVNEPLTTARFCGLYGCWYPHGRDNYCFFKVLLSECKAIVMTMHAIRQVKPEAKLIQTEDLAKCYSTPPLAYQADFENHRRWLSYDLLCGRVNRQHFMWNHMVASGISEEEILYFVDNTCTPDIAGFNYYITSERYLDDNLSEYPNQYYGDNGLHRYADIEIVKVPLQEEHGPAVLLREAWNHLQLPLAITECHMHSTREDQMRWFNVMWNTLNKVKDEGVDIRAITAWAIFGLSGWNRLVTEPWGDYEPGVFNVSSGSPRPTALARLLKELNANKTYYHPVLDNEGWWQRANRHQFGVNRIVQMRRKKTLVNCPPLLILGNAGKLGSAFSIICDERNIHHILLAPVAGVTDARMINKVVAELKPWGIIYTAGFRSVNEQTSELEKCPVSYCSEASLLSSVCQMNSIKLLAFSTNLVFDSKKKEAYVEGDDVHPVNAAGKVRDEETILSNCPDAIIIRSGNTFSPWSQDHFIYETLCALKDGGAVTAANDIIISPTYIPDLVKEGINLLLDNSKGIFHVANNGQTTYAELATQIALFGGYDTSLINQVPQHLIRHQVHGVYNTALKSEKGIVLPPWEHALQHYFDVAVSSYQHARIAV